jgi:hypothetical protein
VAVVLHCPDEPSDAVLDTLVVPLAVLPTAAHDPAAGQDRPEMAENFGGGTALAHVDPPSPLERKTGPLAPLPVFPAAMHDPPVAQATS